MQPDEAKKQSEELEQQEKSGDSRRSFLQMGALAAGAAALGSEPLQAQDEPENSSDVAALVDPQWNLDNFQEVEVNVEPIQKDKEIEITALDFTQGLTVALKSIKNLDEGIRGELLQAVTAVETGVRDGNVTVAIEALHVLRDLLDCYTFEIDIAVGVVGFSETTSFSQMLIILVDFMIRLRTRIIGVIYVFPPPQVIKIIEVFQQFTTCLTIIQIQQFEIYLRFWLFILAIRFSFGWLGLRISIDILLIFISICLRIRIVNVFRICITTTRRLLLLVRC